MVMKNKKLISMMIVVLSLFFNLGVHTRVRTFKSDENLRKYLRESGVAVVMFYRTPDRPKDADKAEKAAYKDELNDLKDLRARFEVTSKSDEYKEVDMAFLQGNMNREDVQQVAAEFGVQTVPAFLVFYEGVPIKQAGKPVMLTGDVSRLELNEFVDKYLGDKIDEISEEKEKVLKRKLQEARLRSYYAPYWYGYPYWGPYWGYGWGWGWPYYGWGWGW